MKRSEKIKKTLEMLDETEISGYRIAKDTGISANQISRWKRRLNEPGFVYLDVLYAYLKKKKLEEELVDA